MEQQETGIILRTTPHVTAGGHILLELEAERSAAELAESEGHHPDFSVHYSKLDVTLWTHAIGGLSENDFILAAKIDRLPT